MGFLSGKRILVTGVASKLSIAYGIAQAMHREGAELAFTYQNDKLKGRVEEFAAQLGSDIVLQCDVAEDTSIDTMFAELGKVWPKFDGFVHSIGFAPGDQLDGDYVNAVTREGFKIAHDISSYSFVAMAKACRSMLNPGSALLTLSYLGAEQEAMAEQSILPVPMIPVPPIYVSLTPYFTITSLMTAKAVQFIPSIMTSI